MAAQNKLSSKCEQLTNDKNALIARLQKIKVDAQKNTPEFSTKAGRLSTQLENAFNKACAAWTSYAEINAKLAKFADFYIYTDLSLENIQAARDAVALKEQTNTDWTDLLNDLNQFDLQATTTVQSEFDALVTEIETLCTEYKKAKDAHEAALQKALREEQERQIQALKPSIEQLNQRIKESEKDRVDGNILTGILNQLDISGYQLAHVKDVQDALKRIESICTKVNTIPDNIPFRGVVKNFTASLLEQILASEQQADRQDAILRLEQVTDILSHISSESFQTWMPAAKDRFSWKNRYGIKGNVSDDPSSEVQYLRSKFKYHKPDMLTELADIRWNADKNRIEMTGRSEPCLYYWNPNEPELTYIERASIKQYFAKNPLFILFLTAIILTCALICLAIVAGIIAAFTGILIALLATGPIIEAIFIAFIFTAMISSVCVVPAAIPASLGFIMAGMLASTFTQLFKPHNEVINQKFKDCFESVNSNDSSDSILHRIRVHTRLQQGIEGLKTLRDMKLIPENLDLEKAVANDELMNGLMETAEDYHQAIVNAAKAPGKMSSQTPTNAPVLYSPLHSLYPRQPDSADLSMPVSSEITPLISQRYQ